MRTVPYLCVLCVVWATVLAAHTGVSSAAFLPPWSIHWGTLSVLVVITVYILFTAITQPTFPRPPRGARFLVTGASSGIGRTLALRLHKSGYIVYGTALNDKERVELEQCLTSPSKVVVMDVTSQDSVWSAYNIIAADCGTDYGLHGVVNNAGILTLGLALFLPVEDFKRILDVNVLGQLRVSQAFYPLLRRCKGRIVFTASLAGRVAGPWWAAYACTKHAVEAIAVAMRMEVLPYGHWVAAIEPGLIRTPMADTSGAVFASNVLSMRGNSMQDGTTVDDMYGGFVEYQTKMQDIAPRAIQSPLFTSPERVADAMCHALLNPHPKTRYLVGWTAYAAVAAFRLIPEHLLARVMGLRIWMVKPTQW